MCGTPNYIAPEILESKYYFTQIIQMGVILMKLISGVWALLPMLVWSVVLLLRPTM